MQQIKINPIHNLFVRRLEEAKNKVKGDIVPFPIIFQKLCVSFSIPKKECWEALFALRDLGLIEIVPYHGIKIN